ncbi:MAG: hypothetical protein GY778_03180, partial [bacterium]|nr:hypothetical protein [bacterium]
EVDGRTVVGFAGTGSLVLQPGTSFTAISDNFDNFLIGGATGGQGTVQLTGPSATLTTIGIDNTVQVGRFGGTGTLTVDQAATLRTLQLEAGRDGSGTLTLSGDGTQVIVSNDHGRYSDPYGYQAGFARAGRDAGSDGTFNVLDGARLEIRSGIGVNQDTTVPGLVLAAQPGSMGTLLIDGAGSIVDVFQIIPDAGFGAPFLTVGNSGDGFMTVSNGGMARVSGDKADFSVALGFAADEGFGRVEVLTGGQIELDGGSDTFFSVGIRPNTMGEVLVSGATSQIDILGLDPVAGNQAGLFIGDAGSATFEIEDGGVVNLTADSDARVHIGDDFGASGSLTVEGAGSQLNLTSINASNDATTFGSTLFVGSDGMGMLNIAHGGEVNVTSFARNFVAIGFGVDGDGTVVVAGAGSAWSILTTDPADGINTFGPQLNVGSGGSGDLTVTDGGLVRIGAVSGGAHEGAGQGFLGIDFGNGTATVSGMGSAIEVDG